MELPSTENSNSSVRHSSSDNKCVGKKIGDGKPLKPNYFNKDIFDFLVCYFKDFMLNS